MPPPLAPAVDASLGGSWAPLTTIGHVRDRRRRGHRRRDRRLTRPLKPDEIAIAVEASTPAGGIVGRVDETGEAARDLIGVRVLAGPFSACGECDVCRRGRVAVCPARETTVVADGRAICRARWVTPLTGPLEGALPGPSAALVPGEAALAYEMFARAGVAPGEQVDLDAATTRSAGVGRRISRARSSANVDPPDAEGTPLKIFAAELSRCAGSALASARRGDPRRARAARRRRSISPPPSPPRPRSSRLRARITRPRPRGRRRWSCKGELSCCRSTDVDPTPHLVTPIIAPS